MKKFAFFVATGFGLGLVAPVAPGTIGSFPGVVLAYLTTQLPVWAQIVAAALLALAAVPICGSAERTLGIKDDGRISADEWMLFPIALIGIPLADLPWWSMAVFFVIVRFVDIVKPWPCRVLQSIHGGLGIVIDDFFANLYSLGLNWLVVVFLLNPFCCASRSDGSGREPVKVIFDTDMLTDYDDIGAIAVLHALADAGECEILATVSSTRGNSSVAVCEVVNAWYGRPDIPVGCVRGIGVGGRPTTGDGNDHGKFSWLAAKYARFVKHPDSSQAPDALEVYRQVLSAHPDGSVTICTVGFISNLRRLVEAYPELVAKKVKLWVAMACRYPDGEEYNSSMDAESSRIAFEKWPTPIVFSDFDYGRWIFTGRRIAEDDNATGPVKELFSACLPARSECGETTYDRKEGHPSWDETAVLYAVRGAGDVFGLERGTYRMAPVGGRNVWKADPSSRDARIVEKLPKAEVGRIIDELMCRRPRSAKCGRGDRGR